MPYKTSEARRAYRAKHYAKNREKYIANATASYEARRHEILADGPQRDIRYAKTAQWKRDNPQKCRAIESRRRARARNQLCLCCLKADIDALFIMCPPGHEVDHRLPLSLGGLHCLKNLQVLSDADHLKKTADDLRNLAALRRARRLYAPKYETKNTGR